MATRQIIVQRVSVISAKRFEDVVAALRVAQDLDAKVGSLLTKTAS